MGRIAAGITKRKDGRLMTTFTVDGVRYAVYGKTTAEVKEKELLKRREIADGTMKEYSDMTFSEFYEKWIDDQKGRIKESAIKNHTSRLKRFSIQKIDRAGHTFGALKIGKIKECHIIAFEDSLINLGDGNEKPLSTRTINGYLSAVRAMLQHAVEKRAITFNPADGIRSLIRTEEEARETIHRALTLDETHRFFEAARGSWYYDLYVFLINTGCRIGEAGALDFCDVDEESVSIKKTLTFKDGAWGVGDSPKTKKGTRTIPLTAEARHALERQKKFNMDFFGYNLLTGRRFFTNQHGGFIIDKSIIRDIERICKKSGVERFTPHAFRDTFATRAIESGMNPKTLAEILGHTDISITMNLYTHVMEETKAREMAVLKIAL